MQCELRCAVDVDVDRDGDGECRIGWNATDGGWKWRLRGNGVEHLAAFEVGELPIDVALTMRRKMGGKVRC